MTEEIYLKDSKHNIQFLKDTLEEIDEHVYTVSPAEGKWSIQLILDHLALTESVIVNLSNGPTTETDRDPTPAILNIKTAFADHKKVYPNPGPVTPRGLAHSAETFIMEIEDNRRALLDAMQGGGTHQILELFAHPLSGKMTRLEWLYFNIYHTERHIHQIKLIKQNPTFRNA